MTEEETLSISLLRKNGEYTIDTVTYKYDCCISERNGTSENLHAEHMEKVLNHFGKKGWVLKTIDAGERNLEFCRTKKGFIGGLFRKKIHYRIRNVYREKQTGLFEIGADSPFGENSSFEDFRLDTIEKVIEYFKGKYGSTFLLQSPEKEFKKESLIKLYFCKQ